MRAIIIFRNYAVYNFPYIFVYIHIKIAKNDTFSKRNIKRATIRDGINLR